jgi:hypothetical protein
LLLLMMPLMTSYAAADYRRFRSMNEPRNSVAEIRRWKVTSRALAE